jgi:hypothetical protein
LSYQEFAPTAFPHKFNQVYIPPFGSNGELGYKSGDIIKFYFRGNDFLDPWSTFLKFTVTPIAFEEGWMEDELPTYDENPYLKYNFHDLSIKNKTLQIDGSAHGFFSQLEVYDQQQKIEQISQYDVLANILKDINYGMFDGFTRAMEGIGTHLGSFGIGTDTSGFAPSSLSRTRPGRFFNSTTNKYDPLTGMDCNIYLDEMSYAKPYKKFPNSPFWSVDPSMGLPNYNNITKLSNNVGPTVNSSTGQVSYVGATVPKILTLEDILNTMQLKFLPQSVDLSFQTNIGMRGVDSSYEWCKNGDGYLKQTINKNSVQQILSSFFQDYRGLYSNANVTTANNIMSGGDAQAQAVGYGVNISDKNIFMQRGDANKTKKAFWHPFRDNSFVVADPVIKLIQPIKITGPTPALGTLNNFAREQLLTDFIEGGVEQATSTANNNPTTLMAEEVKLDNTEFWKNTAFNYGDPNFEHMYGDSGRLAPDWVLCGPILSNQTPKNLMNMSSWKGPQLFGQFSSRNSSFGLDVTKKIPLDCNFLNRTTFTPDDFDYHSHYNYPTYPRFDKRFRSENTDSTVNVGIYTYNYPLRNWKFSNRHLSFFTGQKEVSFNETFNTAILSYLMSYKFYPDFNTGFMPSIEQNQSWFNAPPITSLNTTLPGYTTSSLLNRVFVSNMNQLPPENIQNYFGFLSYKSPANGSEPLIAFNSNPVTAYQNSQGSVPLIDHTNSHDNNIRSNFSCSTFGVQRTTLLSLAVGAQNISDFDDILPDDLDLQAISNILGNKSQFIVQPGQYIEDIFPENIFSLSVSNLGTFNYDCLTLGNPFIKPNKEDEEFINSPSVDYNNSGFYIPPISFNENFYSSFHQTLGNGDIDETLTNFGLMLTDNAQSSEMANNYRLFTNPNISSSFCDLQHYNMLSENEYVLSNRTTGNQYSSLFYGSENPFPAAFSIGCFEPMFSKQLLQRTMQNGVPHVGSITSRTFYIPLISGVLGSLMPAQNFKLLPLRAFKELMVQITVGEHPLFTSWHENDQKYRRVKLTNVEMYFDVAQFYDDAIYKALDESLAVGISIQTVSWYCSCAAQYTTGVVPTDLILTTGYDSLKALIFCYYSQDYLKSTAMRKHYRWSMNLKEFQLINGNDFYPKYPITGNGGSNDGVVTNGNFLYNLKKIFSKSSNDFSFINASNFAVNYCEYDWKITENEREYWKSDKILSGYTQNGLSKFIPRIIQQNGKLVHNGIDISTEHPAFHSSHFYMNRTVGRAIYGIDLDSINYEMGVTSGINTTVNRPFILRTKTDPLPYLATPDVMTPAINALPPPPTYNFSKVSQDNVRAVNVYVFGLYDLVLRFSPVNVVATGIVG